MDLFLFTIFFMEVNISKEKILNYNKMSYHQKLAGPPIDPSDEEYEEDEDVVSMDIISEEFEEENPAKIRRVLMFIKENPILHSLLRSGVAVFLMREAIETKYGNIMVNGVPYSKKALQKILVTLLLFNVGNITTRFLHQFYEMKKSEEPYYTREKKSFKHFVKEASPIYLSRIVKTLDPLYIYKSIQWYIRGLLGLLQSMGERGIEVVKKLMNKKTVHEYHGVDVNL